MTMMQTLRRTYNRVRYRDKSKEKEEEKKEKQKKEETPDEKQVRRDELEAIVEKHFAINIDSDIIIRNLKAILQTKHMNRFSDDELGYMAKRFYEKASVIREAYNTPGELYYGEAQKTAMYFKIVADRFITDVCCGRNKYQN